MDNTERFIPVQICYAEPENHILIDLEVPDNTRLIDALNLSGIEKKLPLAVKEDNIGIFGKKKKFDTLLKANDRIEIYRHWKILPRKPGVEDFRTSNTNNTSVSDHAMFHRT